MVLLPWLFFKLVKPNPVGVVYLRTAIRRNPTTNAKQVFPFAPIAIPTSRYVRVPPRMQCNLTHNRFNRVAKARCWPSGCRSGQKQDLSNMSMGKLDTFLSRVPSGLVADTGQTVWTSGEIFFLLRKMAPTRKFRNFLDAVLRTALQFCCYGDNLFR